MPSRISKGSGRASATGFSGRFLSMRRLQFAGVLEKPAWRQAITSAGNIFFFASDGETAAGPHIGGRIKSATEN
jgi:hypothetical protein